MSPIGVHGYRVRIAGTLEGWVLAPGGHCIGRSRDCAVCVDHTTVSRRHVEVEILAEGGVIVRDLGSTNGSWLGKRRIQHVALVGDFDLRVGAIELEFDPLPLVASKRAPAELKLAELSGSHPVAGPKPTSESSQPPS